jgi:HupE / UreJ protein
VAAGRQRVISAAALVLSIAVGAAWFGRVLVAHDLERTEVTLSFVPDGSFILDVANDPDWLLLRLEPFAAEAGISGRPRMTPSQPLAVDERDALLASFAPVVIDRVVLWVDGREVRPSSAEFIRPRPQMPADDLSPLATYRLRGRMSTDVRSLRWFYGIVIDPYPLTIRRADGRELKETILGKAWSETIDLAGQFDRPSRFEIARRFLVLGFRHVVPNGVNHLLFVFVLTLLALKVRPIVLQMGMFVAAQLIGSLVTAYGILHVPPRLVEQIVVLSIVYVVVENLVTRKLTLWRLALVLAFGVFHGAAVAGAFNALSAPPAGLFSALFWFNGGVVAGELSALVAAWLIAAILARRSASALSRSSARG